MLIRETLTSSIFPLFSPILAVIPPNGNKTHLTPPSPSLPRFRLSSQSSPTFLAQAQTFSRTKPSIDPDDEDDDEDEEEIDPAELPFARLAIGDDEDEEGGGGEGEGFSGYSSTVRGEEENDYDKDPEFADILNSCIQNPQKGQSRVEERIRKKRNKILQTKTGSGTPMKVTFNKFDFSNSYIWFEFYNAPLPKDVSLICDAIRCWHIIGRLGGCNSMNMQLSETPLKSKIPKYDAIEGANVTPTTFYNIGDFELQDNLARVWVDIGTSEPLLLDVLLNALTTISSDYVGIKQVVFGGSQFENWKENFNVEEAGCSVHKI